MARDRSTLAFTTDRGWNVVLSQGTLHVGAIYLNQTVPVSGAQDTSCILPGTYVAEVTTGQDVNLFSGTPQLFPAPGTGVTIPALAGQVWLTGGNINTVADETPVLTIAGTAETERRDGLVRRLRSRLAPIARRTARAPLSPEPTRFASSASSLRFQLPSRPRPAALCFCASIPTLLFINVDFGCGCREGERLHVPRRLQRPTEPQPLPKSALRSALPLRVAAVEQTGGPS